jgi:hypothetical protein
MNEFVTKELRDYIKGAGDRFAVVIDTGEHKLWTGSFDTREDAEKSIKKADKDRAEVKPWAEFRQNGGK